MTILDRIIRVRRLRERLALADLARAQGQAAADAALLQRVRALVGGQATGALPAAARAARARSDAQVQDLAVTLVQRHADATRRRDAAAQALTAARAAVDAALARRAEQEEQP